jgi:glutamate-ammonia-ligase adenylyltransferase
VETSEGRRPLPARTYYARLTQALVTALTAQMAEGRLYEADMRLRPSGRQGPVATSIAAFETYQREEAWTWEHLALTRARPVTGAAELGARVETFRRDLLARAKDGAKILADTAGMRTRLAEARPGQGPLEAKHGPGRLQDIALVAQAGALLAGAPARDTEDQPTTTSRRFSKPTGSCGACRRRRGSSRRARAIPRRWARAAARSCCARPVPRIWPRSRRGWPRRRRGRTRSSGAPSGRRRKMADTDLARMDPKGLIRESYRIDGIGLPECRSIFLDWAISLAPGTEARDVIPALMAAYGVAAPGHPMTQVLSEGLESAPPPGRRGGRKARGASRG